MTTSSPSFFVPCNTAAESKLGVTVVDSQPAHLALILESLSDLKECDLTPCRDPKNLLDVARTSGAELFLISFEAIQSDYVTVLSNLRHQNPEGYVIVYLTAALEETPNAMLMAGANECLLITPEQPNSLQEAVKKAVISISERELSDGSMEAAVEEFPEIVFSLDLEGRFLHINSAVSHLLGYEQQEMVNSAFLGYIASPLQRTTFQKFLQTSTSDLCFYGLLTLQTSLGIEEDFHVAITLMEGEILCGSAKKIGMGMNHLDWKTEQQSEIRSEIAEEEREAVDATHPEENAPSQLGPYRVTSVLGEGSMGRVYKGFDEHLERDVAIKMINRTMASDVEHIERFRREARLLASISHPNIALIYFFDVWNHLPFFCMEYLPEGSIDHLLKQKKVLDPMTATLFIQQVALGLKKAHEKGVVHLDIKPSNLMVAEKNRIKIVDFGLAATHRDLEENSDIIVGTPAYVAPEQLNDRLIDHRCDIYSLGITYFEMVYGFLPYAGKNVQEIFTKKLTEDLPAAELLNSSVPGIVYDLIRKMSERNPDQRIQGYAELIESLEEIKRSLEKPVAQISVPREQSAKKRSNLYDTSLAEILGNIWKDRFTGRLTLLWLDLNKVIHFQNGMITSVLSNQEGERFLDLLISEKQLRPNDGWKIQTARSDLFTKYSSAMELVGDENRNNLREEFKNLAWKILESLFSWISGEYILEEGIFPEQPGIEISTSDVITQGVRHHTDFLVVSRKLSHGKIKIAMSPQSTNRLRQVRLTASERFLLLKTEGGISFSELHSISNLPREIFGRLVYLFFALGLVQFEPYNAQEEFAAESPQASPTSARRNSLEVNNIEMAEAKREETEKFELNPAPAQQQPANLVDQYCRQAAEDYGNGQYWSAVQHCKKALESKQDFRIYHLMGKALAKHQGFKYDAMKAFKTALELKPENVLIQKDMADLYLSCGNVALAEAHYKRILANNPHDKHCTEKIREILHRNDFSKVVGRTIGKFFGARKVQINA